jgi:hypothetical protein
VADPTAGGDRVVISIEEIREIRTMLTEEIREMRTAVTDLNRTMTDYMITQGPVIATLDTRVIGMRSDIARVEAECDRALTELKATCAKDIADVRAACAKEIDDVKADAGQDLAEVKADLATEQARRWMVYTAGLGSAVTVALFVLQLIIHTGK